MIAIHILPADILHSRSERPSILIDELVVRIGDLDERGVVLEGVLRNLRQEVTDQR